MSTDDFSFRKMAPHFLEHISKSIPGYPELIDKSLAISRRFVRSDTNVIDVGCSAGNLISGFQQQNVGRAGVSYIGVDIEENFKETWKRLTCENLQFVVDDVRRYRGYQNCSLVSSFFTLQFIKERDRLPLLRKIHDGLIDGGAILVAEKVLANTGRMQDALTFPYYDFKRGNGFSAEEVLQKEKMLRGQMVSWTLDELLEALSDAGFSERQIIWCDFPFVAVLAVKNSYSKFLTISATDFPSNSSISHINSVSHDRWKMNRRILTDTLGEDP